MNPKRIYDNNRPGELTWDSASGAGLRVLNGRALMACRTRRVIHFTFDFR
jgi:hypothetical protein